MPATRGVAEASEFRHRETSPRHHVLASAHGPAQAMMRSQRGPLARVPFVSFPIDRTSRFDPAAFRTLLLRRLRLPPPLSVRNCQCGRPLDALGHHRAACATAGVLGRRGWALGTVAARVCWQRITTWTAGASRWWQTDYLFTVVPSWPLTPQWCHLCTGMAERGEAQPGPTAKLWKKPADARKGRTPNLPPVWLSSELRWEAVGPKRRRNSFHPSRGPRCANCLKSCRQKLGERGSGDGRGCWRVQPRRRSQCLWWVSGF